MFLEISNYLILGKPAIMWGGLLTLLSFLLTATVGFLNYRGVRTIPFKWHPVLAGISITLALFHGTLGILRYL